MENKYIFSLNNQSPQLLNDSNLSGRDVSIVKEEEDSRPPHCFFTSVHLNSLTNPIEIWARGLSLIALYNGAGNLNYNPNSIFAPYDYKPTGLYIWDGDINITPSEYYNITGSNPFDNNLPIENSLHYPSPNNKLDKVVRLSRSEKTVFNLLLQLSNDLNWTSLYAIVDSIKTYSKQQGKNFFMKVLMTAGYTENNLKAFTGTANNFGLLGTDARHGDLQFGRHQNTMLLKEAQTLVLALCNSYLSLAFAII